MFHHLSVHSSHFIQASMIHIYIVLQPSTLRHQTPTMATTNTAPSTNPTPQESETYTASCHCRSFIYTITTFPPLSSPTARISQCNCSICIRNGYLMIYPSSSEVVFVKGDFEELSVRLPNLNLYPTFPLAREVGKRVTDIELCRSISLVPTHASRTTSAAHAGVVVSRNLWTRNFILI